MLNAVKQLARIVWLSFVGASKLLHCIQHED
jgi:hypothetical protein